MSMGGRTSKVKNKHAASVQITAEQLLREANERQIEYVAAPPRQDITDPEELNDMRMKKRKGFEDAIRKNRANMGNWIKYGAWEDNQGEVDRARSIYERALVEDHRNVSLWLKYTEMEMKHKQVNHARNLWDKAVTILPRVQQFWYKYTYMEEMLGNVAGARQIFERWMEWHPEEQAWHSYIKMELRYGEISNARSIYERFVLDKLQPQHWIKYAKFEISNGEFDRARSVYERGVHFFGEDNPDEKLLVNFARFEETQKEYDRARVVYQFGLDKIPKVKAKELFSSYTQFEKKFGSRSGVESVIVSKRTFQYEEAIKKEPHNYDAWFDYARLMEEDGDVEKARDVFERAIANVPPVAEKNSWRRYIYLWINYAVFEELTAKDADKVREVYKACLDMMPHKTFTFAKIWLLAAFFEVRQKNLAGARKLLGRSLGMCPKDKLFKGYIELELQLREFDRCRTLYNKFLEFNMANCQAWSKYAELEAILGETERARAIYELAVSQPLLDMPEVLWKAFIDFETELGEFDRTRELYEKLLERTSHVKVWISYATFEASVADEEAEEQARHVYETADKEMKKREDKAERKLLLEAWLSFEEGARNAEGVDRVRKLMPRQVKSRRKVYAEDGSVDGHEEFWDYVYPDEENVTPFMSVLQKARQWKEQQARKEAEEAEEAAAAVPGAAAGEDLAHSEESDSAPE